MKKNAADHWLTWQSGQGLPGWWGECVLRRYGIAVQKRRLAYHPGDSYGVLIHGQQAVWAEYLLIAGGYPLNSPLLNPRHAATKRGALPPAWGKPAKPRGVMGWFFRLMGALFASDTAAGRTQRSTKRR